MATLAATRFDIDPIRVQLARLARWRRNPLARRTAALGTALAMHLAILATILSPGTPQPAAKEVSAEATDGMVVGLVRLDTSQAHARAQADEPAAQPPPSPAAPLTDQTPTAADPAPASPPSPPAASSIATAAEGELAVADRGTPQAYNPWAHAGFHPPGTDPLPDLSACSLAEKRQPRFGAEGIATKTALTASGCTAELR